MGLDSSSHTSVRIIVISSYFGDKIFTGFSDSGVLESRDPRESLNAAGRTCVHLGVPVDVQAAESPVPLKPFCAADVRDDVETGTSHSYDLKMLGLS